MTRTAVGDVSLVLITTSALALAVRAFWHGLRGALRADAETAPVLIRPLVVAVT